MRAILFLEGSSFDIYYLEMNDGASEIRAFLDDVDNRESGAQVRGFINIIGRIAEGGWPFLTTKQKKCWPHDDRQFCELIKGDWRIGCFPYGRQRRLLLTTVFRKHGDKEKGEYTRATNLLERFEVDPQWG